MKGHIRSHLVMDAQALENLEIFEVQGKKGKTTKGSLYSYIDKCSTKFGQRLLRKWMLAPLCNPEKLRMRHDAVEELVYNYDKIEKFKREMKTIGDLEKYLVRIYKYSVETQSKAIYLNINAVNRLDEFCTLLTQFRETVRKLDKTFARYKVRSRRLIALTT